MGSVGIHVVGSVRTGRICRFYRLARIGDAGAGNGRVSRRRAGEAFRRFGSVNRHRPVRTRKRLRIGLDSSCYRGRRHDQGRRAVRGGWYRIFLTIYRLSGRGAITRRQSQDGFPSIYESSR